MWKVILQVSSEDLSVLLTNLLDGNNPLTLIVRTIVPARTVIYAEGFGAELVRAERVLSDVGFTVGAMRGKVTPTDYTHMFTADQAANEVYVFNFIGADFTALLSCDALHEMAQLYTPDRHMGSRLLSSRLSAQSYRTRCGPWNAEPEWDFRVVA